MMISPKSYVEKLKGADYKTLIKERDQLIEEIVMFEKKEMRGDRSGDELRINPSPNVIYQVDLQYLAELCSFMHDKYNEEYVWGDKSLSTDE